MRKIQIISFAHKIFLKRNSLSFNIKVVKGSAFPLCTTLMQRLYFEMKILNLQISNRKIDAQLIKEAKCAFCKKIKIFR